MIPPVPVIPRAAKTEPRPEDRPMVGRVIGDKYGVTGLIGEGGMGAVYEAEHLAIGRRVAVKVLHPKNAQSKDAVSRLHHEARVVGTIGHPNICEIYDIGRLDDGSPYLVMERLHGETLAERILRDGCVPAGDLVDVMVQVLSALVVAHEKGIIHRDLKPDNIFLSQRAGMPPIAKLLDFGISKAANVEDSAVNITRTGMVMGTPYYMAPEQARGDRTLDQRVDLWAAGVILYEGLSGRRPFVARNYNALLVQILTSRHKPLAELILDLPAGLVEIIDKLLSKMREDRFQSAWECQEQLMEIRRASRSSPPLYGAQVPRDPRFGQGRALLSRASADRSSRAIDKHPVVARPIYDVTDERPTIPTPGPPAHLRTATPAVRAPRPAPLPVVIRDESTNDDATIVLPRKSIGAHVQRPAVAPPSLPDPTPDDYDPENTVVDPPSFLSDSATYDTQKPAGKR